RSKCLGMICISLGCGKNGPLVTDVSGECLPIYGLDQAQVVKLADALATSLAQRLIAQSRTVHADDRELVRQAAVQVQIEQRRDQLAPCQIPGATKDDEHDRIRLVSCIQHLAHSGLHCVSKTLLAS